MNMKHWVSYMDTGRPKSSEKNLFHCHLVHHKYHNLWPGSKHGPHSERCATIRLSYDTASCLETSECNSWWEERTLSSQEHYGLKNIIASRCTLLHKLDPQDWNKRTWGGRGRQKKNHVSVQHICIICTSKDIGNNEPDVNDIYLG